MSEQKAHMVKQTITFSDGTETVINYRGVIENGVLTPDKKEEAVEEPVEVPETVEETVDSVEESEE